MGKFKAYNITLTPIAEQSYLTLHAEAAAPLEKGDDSHPAVKRLRLVDDCVDRLIPSDPFAKDRALVGSLSNIFRVKKGRMRICYAASSVKAEIVILYISETPRKQGDTNDPYRLFSSLVMSGEFDSVFEALGVRKPPKLSAAAVVYQ